MSAQRIEGAIVAVGRRIRLEAEVWSTPTGLLLSVSDTGAVAAGQVTRVLRLQPGDLDLKALCEVDEIAERVVAGVLSPEEGLEALRRVNRPRSRDRQLAVWLAFGLVAGAVAVLLRSGWTDILVASALGLLTGGIMLRSAGRPAAAEAAEAIAALAVTVLASAFAAFVAPLSLQAVTISALIVLMPGLSLTTAVSELASQHLASGSARFAGAVMTLLKLTFGSVAGAQLVAALRWVPQQAQPDALPVAVELVALAAASFAFAVLFRAARRDVPIVMASAALGYALTRLGYLWFGTGDPSFAGGVFFASLAIAALSNAFGRWAHRPGALVRIPGIMLLVPGSVGFRSLSFVMERDYALGAETAVAVLSALVALVAGLLFGSLVVAPRRYL